LYLFINSDIVHCRVVLYADCCVTFYSETSKASNNSQTGEADKTVQEQKVSLSHFMVISSNVAFTVF